MKKTKNKYKQQTKIKLKENYQNKRKKTNQSFKTPLIKKKNNNKF